MVVAACAAVVDSTLPGSPAVPAVELDRVLRHAPSLLSATDADERGRAAAAMVWALVRAGRAQEAMALGDRFLEDAVFTRSVADHTMEDLLVTSASAYVTKGWTQRATPLALRALDYATDREDAAGVYRAHGVLALSRALNGEYGLARASISRCDQFRERAGWSRSVADYFVLVAQTLCSAAAVDSAQLRTLARQIRAITPKEPLWELTARLGDAMALLIDNDPNRALPVVVSVLNSSDQVAVFDILRGFALGMHADLLLGRGEARRVLALLESHSSPPGHVLCFDMQRAAAHLLMGDDRQALVVTDPCIRMGSDHCLRTIPPLLLRRAVAHERLEQHDIADETFEEAFHLVAESGSAVGMLTLPRAELLTLLGRLAHRRPEYEPQISAMRSRLDIVPPADQERARLAPLTPRERVLAEHLRSTNAFPAIASLLHVSVATVRSQARSLYSKLGVNSRDDAVAVLERAGFYS